MMEPEKKNKHMTLEDRIEIQECLNKGMTFKAIARGWDRGRLMRKKKRYAPEKERKNQTLSCRAENPMTEEMLRPLDSVVGRVGRC